MVRNSAVVLQPCSLSRSLNDDQDEKLAFAFGHIPSVMLLFGLKTIGEIPPALMSEIIFLNSAVSIFAAYFFRKFGFLDPVGIHFWTDIV